MGGSAEIGDGEEMLEEPLSRKSPEPRLSLAIAEDGSPVGGAGVAVATADFRPGRIL